MNPSFPNKGSLSIEVIPLKAKGNQWNFSLFTNLMATKELFNLHFPIVENCPLAGVRKGLSDGPMDASSVEGKCV